MVFGFGGSKAAEQIGKSATATGTTKAHVPDQTAKSATATGTTKHTMTKTGGNRLKLEEYQHGPLPEQWYQGANNHRQEERMATAVFDEIRRRLTPSTASRIGASVGASRTDQRWTNDQAFHDSWGTVWTKDNGPQEQVPAPMPFDPNDDSFYTAGHYDSHESMLKKEGIPAPGKVDAEGASSIWARLSDVSEAAYVFNDYDPKVKHFGRVFQGGLQNAYFVEALQAISLRPKLAKQLFFHFDVQKAIYVVRLYKNGQWARVEIDDFIPSDYMGNPIACQSEYFPNVLWPTLVEKAYAKVHTRRGVRGTYGGWECIGEGGNVDEALTDLTGGCSGRFDVSEVSPDRLFVYFHELQREALFCARVNRAVCEKRGVRLNHRFPYVVNRAAEHEGRCYVQLFCGAPWVEDGGLQEVAPYALIHNPSYPEASHEGFFWMNIADFHLYFSQVFECRLVNSGDVAIEGMPPPRIPGQLSFTPPYVNGDEPWCERIWAFGHEIYPKNAPEFMIITDSDQTPTEVICVASQTDNRNHMEKPGRLMQAPLLLKVYERVEGNYFLNKLICKSNWGFYRDSMVAFKSNKSAEYRVVAELPRREHCDKLIFRVYATRNCEVGAAISKTKHRLVDLDVAPSAVKWTLVGCTLPDHMETHDAPTPFDEFEGRGHVRAWRRSHEDMDLEESQTKQCAVM